LVGGIEEIIEHANMTGVLASVMELPMSSGV
jgi:hypothetical protein